MPTAKMIDQEFCVATEKKNNNEKGVVTKYS